MIYSLTCFFNELDLLDLKIKEESPYVDRIVVVESTLTHSGFPKPINFPKSKYANNPKVLHLVVPDSCYDIPLINEQVSWHREGIQREFPMKVLRFESSDIIISADVDEIINGDRIPELTDIVSSYGFARVGMRGFFYYINGFQVPEWSYAFAETYERYKQYESLTLTRWNINGIMLKDAGSHFSYLGGNEKIKEKLKATAHVEYSGDDFLGTVDNKFESLNDLFDKKFNQQPITIIEIDELYPRTIRENISEWKEYIKK